MYHTFYNYKRFSAIAKTMRLESQVNVQMSIQKLTAFTPSSLLAKMLVKLRETQFLLPHRKERNRLKKYENHGHTIYIKTKTIAHTKAIALKHVLQFSWPVKRQETFIIIINKQTLKN